MTSVDSVQCDKPRFVCEWSGCGKRYGKLKTLRQHQGEKGHGEVETGGVLPVNYQVKK
jgi:hypothetical protein